MNGNIISQGSLDNDNITRVILQYQKKNTHSKLLTYHKKLLLNRWLRDSISSYLILYKLVYI